ncbi:MAG: hypothetical protein NZ700_17775 [Gemmataceae bacterium]|nr:hypothetical protein [Gemmataceae bacterium]MDW8264418.1 hypothetical protein [Gemmataceae bacterium]
MLKRLGIAFLGMVGWVTGTPAQAALDPEVRTPYRLQLVVHFAPHRLLTPVFQEQVRRELRDAMQAALGRMAQVEAVTDHPLLAEIAERGLGPVLEAWKELSEVKTHFVLIDYVEVHYEIQAGQHDGRTGLASPVRRERTRDRPFVARTAVRLVHRDFGLVGTLEKPDPKEPFVQVTFQGAGLGEPLQPWVKKNDVCAVAQIRSGSGGVRSTQVPWALVQLLEEPQQGVAKARLLHRFANPLAGGPGILGYRCLKLGTTKGPLHLRLVDDRTLQPRSGLQVWVSPYGFGPHDLVRLRGVTGPDGLILGKPDDLYEHVAFVRIFVHGAPLAEVPVAILDDRVVVCRVNVDSRAEQLGQLEFRRKRWLGHLHESLLVQAELSKELANLIAKPGLQAAAREKARSSLHQLQADLEVIQGELAILRQLAEPLGPRAVSLADGEQRLAELVAWQQKLQGVIANLDEVIRLENDAQQREARALAEQARLLEERAEYPEAIALYEQALAKARGAQPQLQKYLDDLKSAWKPKNEAHAQARAFIYDSWAKLDNARAIGDALPRAREALATCAREHDKRTLGKLLLATVAHADRLRRELESLRPDEGEDVRRQIQTVEEVAGKLEGFLGEIGNALRS